VDVVKILEEQMSNSVIGMPKRKYCPGLWPEAMGETGKTGVKWYSVSHSLPNPEFLY
jgi:hypothetical protein